MTSVYCTFKRFLRVLASCILISVAGSICRHSHPVLGLFVCHPRLQRAAAESIRPQSDPAKSSSHPDLHEHLLAPASSPSTFLITPLRSSKPSSSTSPTPSPTLLPTSKPAKSPAQSHAPATPPSTHGRTRFGATASVTRRGS
jgi:hypothetical protein